MKKKIIIETETEKLKSSTLKRKNNKKKYMELPEVFKNDCCVLMIIYTLQKKMIKVKHQ